MTIVLIMIANDSLLFYRLFSPGSSLYANYVINWKDRYFSVARPTGLRGDFYR